MTKFDAKFDALWAHAPSSVGEMFNRRVKSNPRGEAFRFHGADDKWASLTWKQAKTTVDQVAAGLLALGLGYEDRIALACRTRIEWILADLGANCAAGAVTTVYPNSGPEEFNYLVSHSDAVILVAEDAGQLAKLDRSNKNIRKVVLIDGEPEPGDTLVMTWQALLSLGRVNLGEDPGCVRRATESCTMDTLATLIYTSGTTGTPKGVELTHRTWVYQGLSFDSRDLVRRGGVMFTWLPLSHVFGKALLAAQLAMGFTQVVDGRPDKIVPNLADAHPHLMCGVPRIYEKVRNAVLTSASKGSIANRTARWAFAVGRDSRPYRLAGQPMPRMLAKKYAMADKLVFSKLRDMMGGNLDYLISGGAKLAPQVQEWYYSAGIIVVEGYGMTEVAVPLVNNPDANKMGTVGTAHPGTEVRIAADGEVLIKGPSLFRGYHKDPDLTAEVLQDGWFSTGDIGFVDSDGYLTITDRKKDLMKTSGGKYVAPQKVENAIAANIPYVSQVVACGDGRKYISALVTLEREPLMRWGQNHGHPDATYEELTQLPEIRASIDKFMAKANSRLERWETVKQYAILDHEFSVDNGTTTPSMKVRRQIITERYADVIDGLYPND